MFTSEQYRVKAAEYAELAKTASSPDEVCEFHKLEKSFTALADNEQWVADHHDQTLACVRGSSHFRCGRESASFDDRGSRLSAFSGRHLRYGS
jgi:hypothetical protein